jgi:hypothetical protein
MFKKLAPTTVAFSMSMAVGAQQHAPTIAVCRADVAVWNDQSLKIEYQTAEDAFNQNKTTNHSGVGILSVRDVSTRAHEMFDCSRVDSEKETTYLQAADFYTIVYDERVGHFLVRHNLWDQFFAEDEAGVR